MGLYATGWHFTVAAVDVQLLSDSRLTLSCASSLFTLAIHHLSLPHVSHSSCLSPQGYWLVWSYGTASTFLGILAMSHWAVLSMPALPRCWSTSAVNSMSIPWKERSVPVRWTTCKTTRCWERYEHLIRASLLRPTWTTCHESIVVFVSSVWYRAKST